MAPRACFPSGGRAFFTVRPGVMTNLVSLLTVVWLTGQSLSAAPAAAPPLAAGDLILATTTSLKDSGLLDVLLPRFEAASSYRVKAIAVGSGEALRMGEQGNADVLIVHSPADEEKFMAAGFGKDRKELMSNDFVLVGPEADPAGVLGRPVLDALRAVFEKGTVFLSRSDGSGTDKKERDLWKRTGLEPKGRWHLETGQGMAETLRIASEKAGYTLTDRGTFLSLSGRLDLRVLVEGEKILLNVYHVITINPGRFPQTNISGAEALMDFLMSTDVQTFIGQFGRDKYGAALFTPSVKGPEEGFDR
ncbi:tungsten ABC transporter substrate-binding protein [bacterium]|nr:MAG: tungsten ABC transporter substrate-binding protein [bacterium]